MTKTRFSSSPLPSSFVDEDDTHELESTFACDEDIAGLMKTRRPSREPSYREHSEPSWKNQRHRQSRRNSSR